MLLPSCSSESTSREPMSDHCAGPADMVSPALAATRGACELKFLVPESVAISLAERVSHELVRDSHSMADAGYHINTLYLDTPQFDIYRRVGRFGRRKFRLRRYGAESLIWLEQKRKREGRVRKRRYPVPETEISWLTSSEVGLPHPADWFRDRCAVRQLAPVCQVTYHRLAWTGAADDGPIRLTIDDQIVAAPTLSWVVPTAPLAGDWLIPGNRIVEMKFCRMLPTLFRTLIQDYRLDVTSFSKYRTAIEACVPLARMSQCSSIVDRTN